MTDSARQAPGGRAARVPASDGVALHAEAHGDGPPLLLSPGYCQTHENFRPQAASLARAGYRVVLWDYRGHGLSEAPLDPARYSMAQVVDDLGRVLDWGAPGRRAVLGGLSFGGLASLHFALAHPSRVRALLLFASGPGFKNPEAQARWEAQVGRIADRLEARGFEGYVDGRAAPTAIGLRPELPAAQAAGRAILAQDPRAVALFGRRVAGPASPSPSGADAVTCHSDSVASYSNRPSAPVTGGVAWNEMPSTTPFLTRLNQSDAPATGAPPSSTTRPAMRAVRSRTRSSEYASIGAPESSCIEARASWSNAYVS